MEFISCVMLTSAVEIKGGGSDAVVFGIQVDHEHSPFK